MLRPHLTQDDWLTLSQPVKTKLIEVFKIPKSHNSIIHDNKVMTDGYSTKDLEAVTLEAMQEYNGEPNNQDFFDLLNKTITKVQL